jgi:copper chaperone CopZ
MSAHETNPDPRFDHPLDIPADVQGSPMAPVGGPRLLQRDGLTGVILLISGMRGNGCREMITGMLEGLPGVWNVEVNLFRARAEVSFTAPCELSHLTSAIERAGYGVSIAGRGPGCDREDH